MTNEDGREMAKTGVTLLCLLLILIFGLGLAAWAGWSLATGWLLEARIGGLG